jgi:hypothetical protein
VGAGAGRGDMATSQLGSPQHGTPTRAMPAHALPLPIITNSLDDPNLAVFLYSPAPPRSLQRWSRKPSVPVRRAGLPRSPLAITLLG